MKSFSFVPKTKWKILRWFTQFLALSAIFIGPVLGGWHRSDRGTLSAWKMVGWDLPLWISDLKPNMESRQLYEATKMVGGGSAVDYFSLPVSDPVLSTMAIFHGGHTWAIIAWLIPLVLALFLGRIFCGWFCPFGLLARFLDRLVSLLPFKHRGFQIPNHKPMRLALLAGAIVGGALGGEWITIAILPHVLFQTTMYGLILLGGLGAVAGVFFSLLLVGLLFGPNIYCSSICPTGAMLGFVGTKKIVNVAVLDLDICGKCTLCHKACWLALDPAEEGGPGSDCDICSRCFSACPRDNMVIRIGKKAAIIMIAFVGFSALSPSLYADDVAIHKPDLVLAGYRETPDYTVALTIIDKTGIQFTQDTEVDFGSEISVYIVKGPKRAVNEEGHRAKDGEIYEGPLVVHLTHKGISDNIEFERPNSPVSTPKRSIFRRRLDYRFTPGDIVEIEPIAGFFSKKMLWTIPEVHPARGGRLAYYFLSGILLFGGLILLALGLGASPTPKRGMTSPSRDKDIKE